MKKSRFMFFTPWINLFFVQQYEIQVGLSRVELHSFIGGGGYLMLCKQVPPISVFKYMMVKTEAMLGYDVTLTSKELCSANYLAF